MTAERKIVDVNSQEAHWDEIKESKLQRPIEIDESGCINAPPPDGVGFLKLVLIADTHSAMGEMIAQGLIPDGDVLIHAGDITKFGDEDELRQFNEQLAELPHRHKLVIAGNHELGLDETEDQTKRKEKYQGRGTPNGHELLTNCTFLRDEATLIDGVKFYGSSWHPLAGFPFYRPRDELYKQWEAVPEDVDVLITHSPPLGYLDLYPPVERWGCQYLLTKVEEIRPTLHVFGHVHAGYGAVSNGHTTFANAASSKHSKDGFNAPLVYYIAKPDAGEDDVEHNNN